MRKPVLGGREVVADPDLGVEQRLLLTTDGTVVQFLECCFLEPVVVAELRQFCTGATSADADLELTGGEEILRREVLLRGRETGRNYVYADSSIVLDRLPSEIRQGLLSTSQPIGQLLLAQRAETLREVLRVGRLPAGSLAARLGLAPSESLLFRTYRMMIGGVACMLITEHFPAVGFSPAGYRRRERERAQQLGAGEAIQQGRPRRRRRTRGG